MGDWHHQGIPTPGKNARAMYAIYGPSFQEQAREFRMWTLDAQPDDGGTSAFRFGQTAGKFQAILEVLGIPQTRVIPSVWKRSMGLIGQDKDAARQLALRRFRSAASELKFKKHGGRADALLLALHHDSRDWDGKQAA